GFSNATTVISNALVLGGTVSAASGQGVGGLVGLGASTTILNTTTDVTVTGRSNVGGVVGTLSAGTTAPIGAIRNSSAHGQVNGERPAAGPDPSNSVGGLAGVLSGGSVVEYSNATGKVTANNLTNVGGLVGQVVTSGVAGSRISRVSNSFATGDVE